MNCEFDSKWDINNYNYIIKYYNKDILNNSALELNYFGNVVDKVFEFENRSSEICLVFRNDILLNLLTWKIQDNSIYDIKYFINNICERKIPLLATCLLFAIERVCDQILFNNDLNNKKKLYSTLKYVFVNIELRLINRLEQSYSYNQCFHVFYRDELSFGEDDYTYFKYFVGNYIIYLLFAYKRIGDIEYKFIDLMSKGKYGNEVNNKMLVSDK